LRLLPRRCDVAQPRRYDLPESFYSDHERFVRDCHSVWAGMSEQGRNFLLSAGVRPPQEMTAPTPVPPAPPVAATVQKPAKPASIAAPDPESPEVGPEPARGKTWRGFACSAVIRTMARDGFTLEQTQSAAATLGFGLTEKTVYCQWKGHTYRGEYAALTPADVTLLRKAV
jgi:hypothetical protein